MRFKNIILDIYLDNLLLPKVSSRVFIKDKQRTVNPRGSHYVQRTHCFRSYIIFFSGVTDGWFNHTVKNTLHIRGNIIHDHF